VKIQAERIFKIIGKVRKRTKDLHFRSDTIGKKVKFPRRKEMLYMRIDPYNQISQIYNTQNITKTSKTQSGRNLSDQVSISQTGHDYQIAKAAVSEASDIREDKVAQLKAQIDSGEYKVDEGDFASKLLAAYGSMQ
jgi:negative regulator of flagellin synthesis FlgM